MEAAMKDGIEFFISGNNVILTEGIDGTLPAKYFKKVMKKDGTILQENEAVKEEEKVEKVEEEKPEEIPLKKVEE